MYKLLQGAALAALFLSALTTPSWAQEADPADELFAALDRNQDGKLTQAEFTAHPDLTAEIFAKWDTNGDKSVTKAEFKSNYGAG